MVTGWKEGTGESATGGGALALILALSAMGLRGGPPWRAWLTVVAVAGALATLGPYGGPLLWARCVPGWTATLGPMEPAFSWQVRADGHLRDGDGGASRRVGP